MEKYFSEPHEQVVEDALANRLRTIGQYALVIVFGLLPIFFIPVQELSTSYTKVLFVVLGLLAALIAYSFSILRSGSFRISFPWPLMALWLVVIAAFVSSLLSGDFRDSFLGEFIEQQTTLFVCILAVITTVVMQLLNNKTAIMRLYMLLSLSTLLLGAFHIARLFLPGATALSLGIFGSSATVSPLGTWNDLAIFFGLTILLSLVALEQLRLTNIGKILFSAVVAVALCMLAVINFTPVWIVLGFVSLVVLMYALAKGRFTPGWMENGAGKNVSITSLSIALAVFVVSVLFIIGGSLIGGYLGKVTNVSYVEVRPSLQATADIARSVYGSDAVFGVGPNKFVDAWRLHRDQSLNQTVFWNTDFVAGIGYIPTFFITMGIVGGTLWLVFLVLFFGSGIRMLMRVGTVDRTWYFIAVSSFVASVYVWGLAIIYVPGPALMMLAALCTGIFLAAHNVIDPSRERHILLLGNRNSGFILVTITMLIVVGSVSALYWVGRHYVSTYAFAKGETTLQSGKIDESELVTAQAYSLSADDRYARRVAEIQLVRITGFLNETNPSKDTQTKFQNALVNGIQAGEVATNLDKTDPRNWEVLGSLYAAVVPLKFEGAYDKAKSALETARLLDPKNPARVLTLARLELAQGNTAEARRLVGDSISLKANYTDALFFLSQLDILAGNIDAAVASTQATIALEPQNPARYFQLGVLEFSRKKDAEAAQAFEKAVSLQNDYSNARFYLAATYDRLGRKEDALIQLHIIQTLNPDNKEIQGLIERVEQGQPLIQEAPVSDATLPIVDKKNNSRTDTTTTGTQNPDTPLLTPLNPTPEKKETTTTTNTTQ